MKTLAQLLAFRSRSFATEILENKIRVKLDGSLLLRERRQGEQFHHRGDFLAAQAKRQIRELEPPPPSLQQDDTAPPVLVQDLPVGSLVNRPNVTLIRNLLSDLH